MPADDEAQRYAETVELFETILEEFIAPEMPGAEIERAFQTALIEWRRADPERAKQRAEEQRRQAAIRSEAFLQSLPPCADDDPPSATLPPIMADPAWVFRRSPVEGERTFKTSEFSSRGRTAAPDAPRIAEDGPGEASGSKGRSETSLEASRPLAAPLRLSSGV